MNETQLAKIKCGIDDGDYNENLGMERTVDGVLRDIIAMGREPGDLEFDPPIEERGE